MKLELKHLAGYLPYGLNVMSQYNEVSDIDCINWSLDGHLRSGLNLRVEVMPSRFRGANLEHIKPILRPLSDLTKEIEVNGKKFVPINEIAKIHIDWNKDDSNLKVRYSHQRQCNIEIKWNHTSSKELFFSDDLFIMTERVHLNRFWVIQKLLEWHFDIYGLIENGLAIDINTLGK